MKDYSEGLDKDFILSYEIDENINVIVVRYPKKIERFNYTKEKELEILDKMKKQVLNMYNLEERIKSDNKSDKNTAIFDGIASFFNLSIVGFHISGLPIINTCVGTILGLFTAMCIKDINSRKKLLEDYKKSLLFLENKDLISSYLKKLHGEDIELTLNDLDLYYYDDIEHLVNKAKLSCGIFLTQDESGTYKLVN